ncbi:TonB-dependent receptor [Polaribacter sargassicola]|uniref:TonB-dependent receptor n=1 Tax=Polaribacter sargassicola TaxID=2836891 RepID=UPI001F2F6AB9|nr:TonB-dependent receptor [Polaribacter sp. DS7-9]MCG1035363.1 TonB-dependent receptor [Polaribacter sp. DS7-9]
MLFVRIFIFFFLSSSVFAQTGDFFGKVKLSNNEPAMDVFVIVKGDHFYKEVITDFNGEFYIKSIPFNTYKIQFHSLNTIKKEITVTLNTKKKEINTSLELTKNQLDEVKITSKTAETKKETEGFAVNIIKTKEASIRNVQTNELLNSTVGVKLRQNGGLGSNVEYSLNGLSGRSISIFIDGIPISVYGSSFSLNSIPPSMIENIEVYKGVVPGHLADDALGGAINIVMKKGVKTNLNASVSYGSFNTFQASTNGLYRYKNSGFTIKASGFYNYSDNDYKISGKTIVDKGLGGVQTLITARRFNDAYRSTGGMLQFGYTDVKWADQFLVGITGSDDYKEVQHGAFVNTTPYKGRFLESDALLTNLTYLKKDFLVKGLDINVNGLYGKRNRVVNDTTAIAYSWTGERAIDYKGDEFEYIWGSQSENGPTLLNIDRKVASIRSGISYNFNKQHKLLLNHIYSGVDREDTDEMVSLLENTFQQTSDLYKNIFSLSYELNAFNNKLKANIFGKHYRQKVLNTSPEWNESETEVIEAIYESNKNYNGYGLATSYAILPNLTVLASTEKAVRLPSETEVFGDLGDNTIANLTIKPEISHNYNLGVRFGRFNFKKHGLVISTNLFSRNIKDLIGFDIDGWENDELVQYANFDKKSTSKGLEAQIDYTYNNNLGFNFNFSKLSLETKNTAGITVDVPNTPLFTLNTSLRYSIKNILQKNSRLNLFYNAYFTDEFSYIVPQGTNTVGQEKFLIPQQFIQDFGCSYTFPKKKFVLSFDVKNIFDESAYDNLSVQKPGRAFYIKLNYSINKF